MRLALDPEDRIMILAATSGDTGTAALQGFKMSPKPGLPSFILIMGLVRFRSGKC